MRKTSTSTAVKNRWNAENYDQIKICVPKGFRAEVSAYAKRKGISVSSLIKRLLEDEMSKHGDDGNEKNAHGS